jgi:hypothetical protein
MNVSARPLARPRSDRDPGMVLRSKFEVGLVYLIRSSRLSLFVRAEVRMARHQEFHYLGGVTFYVERDHLFIEFFSGRGRMLMESMP